MLTTTVALHDRFARELPELAVPWQAAATPDPRAVVVNDALAVELGLDPQWLRTPAGLRLLTGEELPAGARPVAQAYAGHQFGGWSPRLGDGRALLLGELDGPDGRLRDLHLKGSGRTPFSRGGDGLAALGPMLREHVVSEAMHALAIPTTRSLAVVATGTDVHREAGLLPGAVLARVAASHLRVGSFQYARSLGDAGLLARLVDHALDRHHPTDRPDRALALLESVVDVQADLVARWLLVGFVHGVMNTDNMTISGETIDYGPCAFMDGFDPSTTFSSIDHDGRYAFGNQPAMALWDLTRLAEALLPLLADDEQVAVALAHEALGRFRGVHERAWGQGMAAKLGLAGADDTAPLVEELLALLAAGPTDWTSFFRALGRAARGEREPARASVLDLTTADAWLDRWLARSPDAAAMDRVNPVYVPRNHLVEDALARAVAGDLGPLDRLLDAVTHPFDERPGLEAFAQPAPDGMPGYRTFCGT